MPPASPFTCHVEEDLAPAGSVDAACPEAMAFGPAREARVPVGWSYWTGRVLAAVDGSGSIAHFSSWGLATGYWDGELTVVRPDGAVARTVGAHHVLVTAGAHGFLAVGWLAEVTVYGGDGATVLERPVEWPGTLAGGTPSGASGLMEVKPDGRGGALIALLGKGEGGDGELWAAHVRADGSTPERPFRVVSIPDEDGLLTDSYGGPGRALGAVAIGEDGDGRILVTWGGGWAGCGDGTIAGRWFLPDGTPLGDVFRAGTGVERGTPWGATLVRLLDGSLALRMPTAGWVRRFAGGVPAGGPVPQWLVQRRVEQVTELPDHGVLAFRRAAGEDGTGARVELVDATGRVCVSHVLPPEPPRVERTAPFVGFDGTIVQPAGIEARPTISVLRVWPGALR